MRRRKFLMLLGTVAVAVPLVARADKTRRIGVLMNFPSEDPEGQRRIAAFLPALQKFGWTEGSNIRIDVRWAGDDADLTRRYAEELVALTPEVVLASGSSTVAALQRVTTSVPIIFANIADPIGAGFVGSLGRPGGNTTGFLGFEYSIGGKWAELLKKLAPHTTRVAVLRDPTVAAKFSMIARPMTRASSIPGELIPRAWVWLEPGITPCVKTLRGITAPGILGSTVMRRAKKRRKFVFRSALRPNRIDPFDGILRAHARSRTTRAVLVTFACGRVNYNIPNRSDDSRSAS